MKVSVVIPVYNVKPYLERCVNSVLRQTYKDLEIILVDDGSTDGSGELCDEIATRTPNLLVIHQENQGISGARNAGLKLAKGYYVVFLDGDDEWLLNDGLSHLLLKAENRHPDIIAFKCVHIWNGKLKETTDDYDINKISECFTAEKIFKYLVTSQFFNMSACLLLVRRQLLIDYEIFFPLGYISEDVFWSLHLWQYVQTVEFHNLDFYGYYHREGSVSSTPSIKVYQSYDAIFNYWGKQCDENCQNAEPIRYYLANMWVNRGYAFILLKKEDQDEALSILKRHIGLLEHSHSKKAKRVRVLTKILGVKITVLLLGIYWKLHEYVTK